MPNSKEQLEDIISKGIIIDIFQAEEALSLARFIGKNADIINKNNFGNFFGSIQFILSQQFILAVTRLYEPPNPRYPIKSIPSALEFIKHNVDNLVIEQKRYLIKKLIDFGFQENQAATM